jgi:hypothetical protein
MDDASVLEARIRKLERRQRGLILLSIGLAGCLVAAIVMHAVWVPREVSATRFLLKDATGRIRGEWGPTDVLAGEIDGVTQHASATCLRLVGQKAVGADLCAPWDPYGGPSLVMVEETGASLHVALDAHTVSILGRATRGKGGGNRGRLVLGAWSDGASVNVVDKDGRGTHLGGSGLTVYDAKRAVIYGTPGATAPAP